MKFLIYPKFNEKTDGVSENDQWYNTFLYLRTKETTMRVHRLKLNYE